VSALFIIIALQIINARYLTNEINTIRESKIDASLNYITVLTEKTTELNRLSSEITKKDIQIEKLELEIEKLSEVPIYKKLKEMGYSGLSDFKKKSLEDYEYKNHTVSKVEEILIPQDVFCMTVVGPKGEDDRHNFACLGLTSLEEVDVNSGIYLGNSIEEDFFIAVRGDKGGTRIDTLKGSEYNGVIEDVKYLRDKMFSGIKIPQSYLTYGEGGAEERSTLAQKDVHFARTIQRLQRSVISEFTKIARIHLYILGFNKKDLLNFELSLNSPSKIAELQELEHWKTKFDVAAAATESVFSNRWIAKNIHGLTDEEYLRNLREKAFDKKYEAMLEAIVQAEMPQDDLDAMEGLGGGGGLDDIMGGGSMDSESGGGKEEQPTLLAKPDGAVQEAKPGQKSQGTTTSRSKGKIYHPSIYDKRKSGARKRSWLKSSGLSHAEGGPRNTLPGAAELGNFVNDIFEQIENDYKEIIEEEKLRDQQEFGVEQSDFPIYPINKVKNTLLSEAMEDNSDIEKLFEQYDDKNVFAERIKQQVLLTREKFAEIQKQKGDKPGGKK
jgi:hypothetical protein